MKFAARLVLIAFVAIALEQLGAAQMRMGMKPPDIAGVFNPTVGSGSSYEIVKKDGKKTDFDMAVVDKDSSGGYWVEYGIESPEAHGTVYMKNLLVRQSDDILIQHTIVQMPGHPPMDLSSMLAMKGMQGSKSQADFTANAENLGSESVTTPAGTFSCQHWRSKKDNTDVWISDKVSPWKLVQMKGPDESMTLVRLIAGAKTHITGKPVSMQEMMQQHANQ
jgi:hypothetical protein